MGTDRGAANLAIFNQRRSDLLIPMIKDELAKCRKRHLKFISIGLLAAHISDHVKVHRTTLLRNNEYFSLLNRYLSSTPGTIENIPDSTIDLHVLQAKLATARLEISNLRSDIKKYESFKKNMIKMDSTNTNSKTAVDFSNLAMTFANQIGRAHV